MAAPVARWRPLLLLVLGTPFLTELNCGNVPAQTFFLPHIFGILVLVYGLPVLAIRELAIRRRLGLDGILLLGLAYGVYNEGLCAKTLFLNSQVPLSAFDGYAFAGVNLAWAICILPWHALHSVLYPLLLVHRFYPAPAARSWLSNRAWAACGLSFGLMGLFMFLNGKSAAATPGRLALVGGTMAVLFWLALRMPKPPVEEADAAPSPSRWAALAGGIFYLGFVIGLIVLAHWRVPTAILAVGAGGLLAGVWTGLRRRNWTHPAGLRMFALGDYLAVAAISLLNGIHRGSPELIVTGLVLAAGLGFAIQRSETGLFSPRPPQTPAESAESP